METRKEQILSELFFSMTSDDITSFCHTCGVFTHKREQVKLYDSTYIGRTITLIHEVGESVILSLQKELRGLGSAYMFCYWDKYCGCYRIEFLPDDNNAFESAFDFKNRIMPLLEKAANLGWVIEHSTRKLTDEEKVFIGYYHPVKVTIEYTINHPISNMGNEKDAIKEILGVDDSIKDGSISNFKINIVQQ
ncbi:MAG: hypothetical protein MJ237_06120 [bacterium]|nr:hypothetical protein [bacterium]